MSYLPSKNTGWKDWFVPLAETKATISECLETQQPLAAGAADIPLIVKLVENPKFDIPGISLFNGAVSLEDHDAIHVLLGRGMLPKDEAFIIGFTMGSSNKMSTAEKRMYSLVAKYLYPGPYKFTDEDIAIFKKGAHLGYVSECQPLDKVSYSDYLDMPLGEAREALGIETDLLEAYYRQEARKYPNAIESQRLIAE